MRKTILLTIFLAAACGQGGGNAAGEAGNRPADAPAAPPVQTATLTGLYEDRGGVPSQMCITEQDDKARFGLVIRTSTGAPGCSGAGDAVREGNLLRLTMDGESDCVVEARIEGHRVSFPGRVPAGCTYYCAPGAWMRGAHFTKTGGTRADALRARDIVEDQLCS